MHVLRQRADEIGFRLALLKPGIEEKLYENELELKQGCPPKHNEYFYPSEITLVTVEHPKRRILIKSNLKMTLELLLKHHLVILLLTLAILNHN